MEARARREKLIRGVRASRDESVVVSVQSHEEILYWPGTPEHSKIALGELSATDQVWNVPFISCRFRHTRQIELRDVFSVCEVRERLIED